MQIRIALVALVLVLLVPAAALLAAPPAGPAPAPAPAPAPTSVVSIDDLADEYSAQKRNNASGELANLARATAKRKELMEVNFVKASVVQVQQSYGSLNKVDQPPNYGQTDLLIGPDYVVLRRASFYFPTTTQPVMVSFTSRGEKCAKPAKIDLGKDDDTVVWRVSDLALEEEWSEGVLWKCIFLRFGGRKSIPMALRDHPFYQPPEGARADYFAQSWPALEEEQAKAKHEPKKGKCGCCK